VTYSLETNAVIAILRDPNGLVAVRLRGHAPHAIFASSIVLHELYQGAFRSARVAHNLAQIEPLAFPVLDPTRDDAREAGQVRAELASAGTPIGGYDLLIAGQARARRFTVVTANTRDFERIADLSVEDWARLPGQDELLNPRPKPLSRVCARALYPTNGVPPPSPTPIPPPSPLA